MGVCIQVPNSSEWLGLVTGALLKLTYNYYWDQDVDGWENARDTGKAILNSWFERNPCVAEISGEAGCTDFPLSSGFINWYPENPFINPTAVPDGWTGVPFSFVGSGDILLGYQSGDILVTAFPSPDSGDLTLPAITFNLTGDGTVELHMLTVLNGGQAIVTKDGDLLSSKTFDLNADAISLPEESNALELVYEVTFDTGGDHTVEVRFAPVLDDALLPIRYGGGIRAVVPCGFDEMSLDIRTDPENDCLVQKTYNGTDWVDVINVDDCASDVATTVVNNTTNNSLMKLWTVTGGNTYYSTTNNVTNVYNDSQASDFGQQVPYPGGVPGGTDAKCIAAKNNIVIFWSQLTDTANTIRLGGSVTSIVAVIAGIIGLVGSGGVSAALSSGIISYVGQMTSFTANGLLALFTDSIMQTLECDIENAFQTDGTLTSANYATFMAGIHARVGTAWRIIEYWFGLLGPIGMVAAGMSSKGGVTTCGQDPCHRDWYTEFDFTIDPYPAKLGLNKLTNDAYTASGCIFRAPPGVWVAGKGWKSKTVLDACGDWITRLQLNIDLPVGLAVAKFEVDFNWNMEICGVGSFYVGYVVSTAPGNPANSPTGSLGNNGCINNGQRTQLSTVGGSTIYHASAGDQIVLYWVTQANAPTQTHEDSGFVFAQKLRIYATR